MVQLCGDKAFKYEFMVAILIETITLGNLDGM